ncbi:MAG TPA: alanyl-tRNA editing protein, partial [Bryobacteraceae bacterium]|nr:alanyl-tRNA editing protein [Bryobacteraceae bacterium]
MTTERLYYIDCYLCDFEARVLKVEPGPQKFRVYLDRTAFYPESGGQPMVCGTLAGVPVLEVLEDGDAIVHILEKRPDGDPVHGEINWPRRFDHMQQHTGQHVLSAAFEKAGHYKTVSFHLGSDSSSIDLDSDRLGRRQIEEAEDLANRIVFENREVRISFRPAAEAGRMDLRKPTLREGDVRLVEIDGFDLSACGGTHVRRTGAIGLIAVRKFEGMKGLTRVEFLCGGRALRAARHDYQVLGEASRLFSALSDHLPALIAKQSEALRASIRSREKLTARMAGFEARELLQVAPEKNGRKIV